MTSFGSFLPPLASGREREYLTALAQDGVPAQITRAIQEAHPGRRWRRRRLPVDVAFWFVLGLGLWRDLSEWEVFRNLREAWRRLAEVTDGALAHARERLGAQPLRRFFEATAQRARPAPSFHGFRVYALDGVRADTADTPANAKAFGRPGSKGRARPYPQVLLLLLTAVLTRCVRGACLCPCRTGERTPSLPLLDRLGPGDLLLLDSGFYAAWFLEELMRRGISYIVRLPASVKRLQPLATRHWVEIETRYRPEGRKRRRRGASRTIRIRARLIRYRVGRQTIRLLTNLREIPQEEIIRGYRLRWESETVNDEIKTHLATAAKGTSPVPLRSKSPELVEQEVYALLALYNLLRDRMAWAAERVGSVPHAMSFKASVQVIRRACLRPVPTTPSEAVGAWIRLIEELSRCTLDRPKRPRRAPRVVRKPWRRFPGKQPHHRSQPYDYSAQIRICET